MKQAQLALERLRSKTAINAHEGEGATIARVYKPLGSASSTRRPTPRHPIRAGLARWEEAGDLTDPPGRDLKATTYGAGSAFNYGGEPDKRSAHSTAWIWR